MQKQFIEIDGRKNLEWAVVFEFLVAILASIFATLIGAFGAVKFMLGWGKRQKRYFKLIEGNWCSSYQLFYQGSENWVDQDVVIRRYRFRNRLFIQGDGVESSRNFSGWLEFHRRFFVGAWENDSNPSIIGFHTISFEYFERDNVLLGMSTGNRFDEPSKLRLGAWVMAREVDGLDYAKDIVENSTATFG